MKFILFCAALTFTLPFMASGQRKGSNSRPLDAGSKYQAIVGKDEAVFIFPIPTQRQYEFTDRGILGIHVIKVRNNNEDFEFGFYIDNPLDGALGLGEGNLRELLSAPMGFFKAFKLTKESIHDLDDVRVQGFANDNLSKLTIKVSGNKGLQRLFSGKNPYCTFESRTRDGHYPKTSVRVPIVYGP
jgi:hypothetical protein